MNDMVLDYFRSIAASMAVDPQDWMWQGPHMSQQMYGITEERAKKYATIHGGVAKKMEDAK